MDSDGDGVGDNLMHSLMIQPKVGILMAMVMAIISMYSQPIRMSGLIQMAMV